MDEEKTHLELEGKKFFDKARSQALFNELKRLLMNESSTLWNFNEVKSKLRLQNSLYRGLQDIPVDRIVGSVGRYNDFTREFLPKSYDMQARWSHVYAQMHSLEGVPPIEVYQVDDVYFVRDGNHRVSIARQQGFETIQAHVTELETPIDLEPEMTPQMWETAEAYSDFLRHTRLDKNRPGKNNQIRLSEPSRYHGLLEHIQLTQSVLELEGETATLEEAAIHWYDTIYLPIVHIVRQFDVMQYFPDRTEADLYLWLLNNLYHLRQSYAHGSNITAHDFSEAMLDFLRKHKIPIPDEAIPIEADIPLGDLLDDED